MKNTHSHITRIFAGEERGAKLCVWLNKNTESSSGKRIVRLIKDIRKGFPVWGYSDYERMREGTFPARIIPDFKAIKSVNTELARHKMWPAVIGQGAGPAKTRNYKPLTFNKLIWEWKYGKNPTTWAVHDLVRLGEQGLFDRIRECKKCGKWFFARFRNQLFNSQKCQVAYYKGTENFKTRHREYERDKRRRKK